MPIARGIVVGLVSAVLAIAVAACRLVPANGTPPGSGSQALATVFPTPTQQPSGDVVWGRVPYCNCRADTATAGVVSALEDANLTASVKELSPRDGWLYFAVILPHSATREQVSAALVAGGAQVTDGPP